MIAERNLFPTTKELGVNWLGEVPPHWRVLPIRAVFVEVKESGHSDEQMLSVTISSGVIRQDELLEDPSKKDQSQTDRSAYKLVQPGDIAYNKMRAWQGAIGVSRHRGIVSPAYIVQRPLASTNSTYMHYLFRTPAFAREAERCSYGIASDMWSLRPEDFKTIRVCVPPPIEQSDIARYLNHATKQIEQYIRAKEKLIALLEEQKKVIINQAVTGQIDVRTGQPYPVYKSSGVEGQGDAPAHWNMCRLKNWMLVNEQNLPNGTDPDYTFDYLNIGSVTTGQLIAGPDRIRFGNSPTRARRVVRSGDTIFSMVRPYLKAVWHAEETSPDLIASTGFAVFTPKLNTCPKFVSYLCQSDVFTNQVTANSVGVAYPAIAESKLRTIRIAVPSLDEQISILRHLDKSTTKTDDAITRARNEIGLLQEFCNRLITDAVTGKLDVRDTTAAMPEVDSFATDGTNRLFNVASELGDGRSNTKLEEADP